MSVALAGKIAGNARNNPPKTGPKYFARRPAITVTAPPNANRAASSCHFVRAIFDGAMWTRIRHLKKPSQSPRETANQRAMAATVVARVGVRRFIISQLQAVA